MRLRAHILFYSMFRLTELSFCSPTFLQGQICHLTKYEKERVAMHNEFEPVYYEIFCADGRLGCPKAFRSDDCTNDDSVESEVVL